MRRLRHGQRWSWSRQGAGWQGQRGAWKVLLTLTGRHRPRHRAGAAIDRSIPGAAGRLNARTVACDPARRTGRPALTEAIPATKLRNMPGLAEIERAAAL